MKNYTTLINQFKGFTNQKFSLKAFKIVNIHEHVQTYMYIPVSWTQLVHICQQQHISLNQNRQHSHAIKS